MILTVLVALMQPQKHLAASLSSHAVGFKRWSALHRFFCTRDCKDKAYFACVIKNRRIRQSRDELRLESVA